MAVIWQKQHKGVQYQMRTAGKSRRLYTNGVCHTQYNPEKPITGSVWDLLMLPVLLRPVEKTRRVLVLGLGGGSVIHLLKAFTDVDQIDAVELDAIHIQIAKRFFDLSAKEVHIIHDDARNFIASSNDIGYDLIIDDLFSHEDGVPQRAVDANAAWFRQLWKRLKPNGVLVVNFADRMELTNSAFFLDSRERQRAKSAIQFSHPQLDNRVVAFSRHHLNKSNLRRQLHQKAGRHSKSFRFHSRDIGARS